MLEVNKLLRLEGKTAVVTGGGVGIGFAISYRLAEAGAKVVIADVNTQNLDRAKEELASKDFDIEYVLADVSKTDDVEKMCTTAQEKFGSLDILVNNAGIYPFKSSLELTEEEFEKVMHINLRGAFMAAKTAALAMIKQGKGGKIINITSIDALHPSMVGLAHYDASKHGLWGLTKNMALELAPHNITVNAIAPGGVATPGTGLENAKPSPEIEAFIKKIPMGRMGDADEIGKVTLFIASDMASYMTGSQVVVDGGRLLS